MVDLGISVLSLAIFSRVHQDSTAALKAYNKYQELLNIVKRATLNLDETNVDQTLLAIFTMCRYEDAMFEATSVDQCNSLSHHVGATGVLKLWKDGLSQKLPATEIIKHSRRGLIRSSLLKESSVPEWMQNGHDFGERGRDLAFDHLMVKLLNLRYEMFALIRKHDDFNTCAHEDIASRALELVDDLRDIDDALQDWKAHFPRGWTYRHAHMDSDTSDSDDNVAPWTIYSYSCLPHAWSWNQYVTTCILIDSTRMKILGLCHPSSDEFARTEQLRQCYSRMKTMADQLAANIPFCLQRFKIANEHTGSDGDPNQISRAPPGQKIKPYIANQVVWPLSIAAGVTNMDSKQNAWFKSVLATIGKLTGLGVIESAGTDDWLRL